MGLSLETPAQHWLPQPIYFHQVELFPGAAEFQNNGPAAEDPGTQFPTSFNQPLLSLALSLLFYYSLTLDL